jgi:hypothetical protein
MEDEISQRVAQIRAQDAAAAEQSRLAHKNVTDGLRKVSSRIVSVRSTRDEARFLPEPIITEYNGDDPIPINLYLEGEYVRIYYDSSTKLYTVRGCLNNLHPSIRKKDSLNEDEVGDIYRTILADWIVHTYPKKKSEVDRAADYEEAARIREFEEEERKIEFEESQRFIRWSIVIALIMLVACCVAFRPHA